MCFCSRRSSVSETRYIEDARSPETTRSVEEASRTGEAVDVVGSEQSMETSVAFSHVEAEMEIFAARDWFANRPRILDLKTVTEEDCFIATYPTHRFIDVVKTLVYLACGAEEVANMLNPNVESWQSIDHVQLHEGQTLDWYVVRNGEGLQVSTGRVESRILANHV